MVGENDLNQQNVSMYRKVENFIVSSSQALHKRSGTRLAKFSDGKEMFPVSTSTETFFFFSDNTYTVIASDTLAELKANSPSAISFDNIKTAKIERSSAADGKEVLTIYTKTGWFRTDLSYVITGLVLTGVPSGVDLNIATTVYGRSVIASKTDIYFSAYANIQNFTVPSTPTADSPFVLKQLIGFDTDITDIMFFNETLFIGTKTSIYLQPAVLVNPFTPNQIVGSIAFRKLHNIGVNPSTFTIVGKSLVFANDRGVFMITNTPDRITLKATLELVDLTEQARHITSEDGQSIVTISAYFRKENVFFMLRNDGTVFTCTLVENKPFWSRRTCPPRKYIAIDELSYVLITQDETYYYAEQTTEYPYLSDNKLRFSEKDEIPNLSKFAFLDAYKPYNEIILENTEIVDQHRFKLANHTLIVGNSYTILSNNEYVNIEILTHTNDIYSHDKNITTPFLVIAKFIKSIDTTSIPNKNSEIYVTYAKMNKSNLNLETIKASGSSVEINSFFAIAGLKYEASAHILVRNNVNEQNFTDVFKQIGMYCTTKLVVGTYTTEGKQESENITTRYATTFETYTIPTTQWKNYKHLVLNVPVGHSGVILSVGPVIIAPAK